MLDLFLLALAAVGYLEPQFSFCTCIISVIVSKVSEKNIKTYLGLVFLALGAVDRLEPYFSFCMHIISVIVEKIILKHTWARFMSQLLLDVLHLALRLVFLALGAMDHLEPYFFILYAYYICNC